MTASHRDCAVPVPVFSFTKEANLGFVRCPLRGGFGCHRLCFFALLICSVVSIRAHDNSQNGAATPSQQPAPLAQQNVEIHNAASDGDAGKVSALLKKDPSLLESRDANGMTPLMVASRDGKSNMVTFLIEKGADLKATTTTGDYDTLYLAAKNGQKDVVSILLDKGADANRKDSDGDTPITLAQNEGQAEVLALFKARGYTVSPVLKWVAVETPLATSDSSWIIDSFKASPDSKRVASVAHAGDKYRIVVDGKEGKPYDAIGTHFFSSNSERIAYVAKAGSQMVVVVDGKEGVLPQKQWNEGIRDG